MFDVGSMFYFDANKIDRAIFVLSIDSIKCKQCVRTHNSADLSFYQFDKVLEVGQGHARDVLGGPVVRNGPRQVIGDVRAGL